MKSKKTRSIAKKLSNLFCCEDSEENQCNCCFKVFCQNCGCEECEPCNECEECEECQNNNDECICEIIESIARIETSLSHILNAEGEKIQRAVQISDNVCDLLEVNKSVTATIREVTQLEFILNTKLETILSKRTQEGGGMLWQQYQVE